MTWDASNMYLQILFPFKVGGGEGDLVDIAKRGVVTFIELPPALLATSFD